MPTRYIPMSDDEQKFAALVERVFSDQSFANSMQSDPAKALAQAGYHLSETQREQLKRQKSNEISEHLNRALAGAEVPAISLVRPVVSIVTKGTRPAVSVVTKGTQPAVSVVVNTVVAVEESRAHPIQEATEETRPKS
jgi:hypothetical protein